MVGTIFKQLQFIKEMEEIEELIQNSEAVFKYKDDEYKVHRINLIDKAEVRKVRMAKYTELASTEGCMSREKLVEFYQKQGIDIPTMQNKIKQLLNEMEDLSVKVIKNKDNLPIRNKLKEQIENLEKEMEDLNSEVNGYLQYSIEDELNIFCTDYYTYLALDKKQNDKWVKAFNSYKEFGKSDQTDLIRKATILATYLIHRQDI